jgi:hypothetical protein
VREMHLNDDVDQLLQQSAHSLNGDADHAPNEDATHVQIDQQHYLDLSESYPFRALFRKNFSLQKRQTFTNMCQILTPVLVMAILVLLQLIIRAQLGDNFNKRELVPSLPFPLNDPDLKLPFSASQPLTAESYTAHIHRLQQLYDSTRVNEEIPQNDTNISTSTCLTYFLFSRDEALNNSVGHLTENGTASGLLGKITPRSCQLSNGTTVSVPYFEVRPNNGEINDELFHDIVTLNNNSLTDVQLPPLYYLLPDGYVSFHELNATHAQYVPALAPVHSNAQ